MCTYIARQDKHLLPLRALDQFDLHARLDLVPILLGQVLLELTQHRLGRAHDVVAAPAPKEGQVRLADHPAIHHPDAMGPAVLRFHRPHDLLDRLRVMRMAVKDFIAQGHPVLGHHQTDADLQTIRAAVPGVAPLGHRITVALPLKIRAGHIVQQQLVLQIEEIAQSLLEMSFDTLLVRQQAIQSRIQTVGMDLLGRDAQQVLQHRTSIPVILDMQLVGRFTEPTDHLHARR